jgi:hypothetical protein
MIVSLLTRASGYGFDNNVKATNAAGSAGREALELPILL